MFDKTIVQSIVLPLTSKGKEIPWHVQINAGDAGLRSDSYIMCEMIRSVARERLVKRLGEVSEAILQGVETRLKILLKL